MIASLNDNFKAAEALRGIRGPVKAYFPVEDTGLVEVSLFVAEMYQTLSEWSEKLASGELPTE